MINLATAAKLHRVCFWQQQGHAHVIDHKLARGTGGSTEYFLKQMRWLALGR